MSTTVYIQGKKPTGKYPSYQFVNSFVTANPLVTMLSSDTRNHVAFGGFAADTNLTAPTGYGAIGAGRTT